MKLSSSGFEEGGMIPKIYACDSLNVSPPLVWSDLPEGTRSLAVICEDPDAPVGNWVHWVVFNIPASVKELPEKVPPHEMLPDGAKHGLNDFKKIGYGGPCPPSGTHRYVFTLYALDSLLDLDSGITRDDLVLGMKGHVLGQAVLMGKYRRFA